MKKKDDASFEISSDPLVEQFVLDEAESILKNVELRLLVERMASKYNMNKDKVRKAIISMLKSSLCAQTRMHD